VTTPRVNPADVRNIFLTEATDAELKAWIHVAHRLVEDTLVGEDVSDETLTEIERQLSAHYTTIDYRMAGSTSIGPTDIDYDTEVGLYLNQTRYGQAAKTLDPTGLLAAAEGKSPDSPTLKTF
jgi:hypothetical protein